MTGTTACTVPTSASRRAGGGDEQALLCAAGEVPGGDRHQHRQREGGQGDQQPQQVGGAPHVPGRRGVDSGRRPVRGGFAHEVAGEQHAVPVGHAPPPAGLRGRPMRALLRAQVRLARTPVHGYMRQDPRACVE
ncbi:hypothetical protein ACIRBZ_05290 [Streptomyces sp. NPDC094038]|uniref:hypothetical protein n=1 Tax=Streptomyces sp. NPDC094038 TaxID=3366055 RepID=UPI00382348FC